MKKIFLLLLTAFCCFSLFAQVPQGFSYQAVVRDAQGSIVQNHSVSFQFNIVENSATGITVYTETQQTSTNSLGLVNLAIGNGTVVQGNFSNIQWESSLHFINVKVDITGGNNFVDMGTTQLLSVPYALLSGKSVSDTIWTISGNNIYNNNAGHVGIGLTAPNGKVTIQGDTSNVLFEVRDRNGIPVFIVYQDSVQVFVSNSATKTNKGSFAVNAKSQSKSNTNSYLRVAPDSSRIYTENPNGGFGVRDLSSGSSTSYMNLTPDNYFIGHNAGENLQAGQYNLFLGYQSGRTLYSGNSNICIGYKTGYNGYNYMNENILLGNYAGYKTNSSSNILIGKEAGYNNIRGYDNIYIGNKAGYTALGYDSIPSLMYHANNVIIGTSAGKSLTTLQGNTIIGASACENSTNSTSSTIIGSNACQDGNLISSTVIGVYAGAEATGTENIYIGSSAGRTITGSNNIFIGNYLLGYASNYMNNKFLVKNSSTNFPLLFGDFFTNRLVVNGDSSHNVNSLNFFVNGSAGGNLAWTSISDKKFKTNIKPIDNPLEKILQLKGVNYFWKDKSWGEGMQIGFIAQDVESVLPEVVVKNGDNYGIQYAPITALLVEGIKAQQKKIDQLEKEIKELKEILQKK